MRTWSLGLPGHPTARLRPGYRSGLSRCGAAAGLPAKNLVVEVTESTVMHDAPAAIEILAVLRRTGIAVAIDDFGTGYSSLGSDPQADLALSGLAGSGREEAPRQLVVPHGEGLCTFDGGRLPEGRALGRPI